MQGWADAADGGRSLTVLDWDRLREVAEFDELYLHHPVR